MGNPVVVFTTYGSAATTNVSGHANSTSFVELKSDLVPQSAKFSNGDYSVTDFDTLRIHTSEDTYAANGKIIGSHTNTTYVSREGELGTFALKGGQFELCEFDTGSKGGSIADHMGKSGAGHNYVAFLNTGDGEGLVHNYRGQLTTTSYAYGPPTVYAPDVPFANIEYSVGHTSTPLQAVAGGGTNESTYSGYYINSYGKTNAGSEESPNWQYWWSIKNVGARTGSNVSRNIQLFESVEMVDIEGEGTGYYYRVLRTYSNTNNNLIMENWFPQASYSPSTSSSSIHQGAIKFRVHPDSEYVMSENMTTTNVAVA